MRARSFPWVAGAAMAVALSTSPAFRARVLRIAPLDIRLPHRVGVCFPKYSREMYKKLGEKPRPPFMAPVGTRNVALGKPVTASDDDPILGEIGYVTDGDKEAGDDSFVELGPGRQWVQIDLGAEHKVYAVVFWLCHGQERFFHDVVLQLADDPGFDTNVRTVFNNDQDNSSGLGAGRDREYFESYRGKLVDTGGTRARYVRLHTNGNNADEMNRYIEIDVYGKPVPGGR
ncbi:MAG: discoidin domain-containing protein [Planctomycetota bacterium]